MDKVGKAYGANTVLRAFSHRFSEGGVTCVFGPSGCGKTTLLRLIAGLEAPDSGAVEGCADRRFSAVFQEDRLLENLSAEKNLLLSAAPGFTRADARALLGALGLEADPAQRVARFSGGMKRRVAVARALAAEYDVLLLDEPLTGLDAETRARALALIKKMTVGKTVICVTHFEADAALLGGETLLLSPALSKGEG